MKNNQVFEQISNDIPHFGHVFSWMLFFCFDEKKGVFSRDLQPAKLRSITAEFDDVSTKVMGDHTKHILYILGDAQILEEPVANEDLIGFPLSK